MVEVITIQSSPPTSPVKRQTKNGSTTRLTDHTFDIDDYDVVREAGFPILRAAKRRKRTPTLEVPGRQINDTFATAAFSFSSDIDIPPSSAPVNAIRSRSKAVDDIDDIEFSSSAPLPGINDDVVHILSSDGIEAPPVTTNEFSERVTKLLGTAEAVKKSSVRRPLTKTNSMPLTGQHDIDDIVFSSQIKPSQKSGPARPSKDNASSLAKQDKEAAKEAEKLRKKEAKAEREREKQKTKDLAEVNKSKANKKDTAKEMILELPGSVQGTSVGNQVEEFMRQHEIRFSYPREDVTLSSDQHLLVGKIIRWKREVLARYDDDQGQWIPLSQGRIEDIDHVAVLLNGLDFATIALGAAAQDEHVGVPDLPTMKENVDKHVRLMRRRFAGKKLIYLVQGLYAWVKKNDNAKNREYAAAVRAEVDEPASQPKKRKTKAIPRNLFGVTMDVVEDLQLHLQVNHQPVLIHHTTSDSSTASQILSFTQSLSARPYRIAELEHNLKSASFYMGSGQFKTGEDAQETFVKMLENQQRVTPSIAQSVVSRWSSPRELVAAFRRNDNLMLEDVRKSTNKDGGYSDKRIGPVISKRMYKVFLGRDPEATSGMS